MPGETNSRTEHVISSLYISSLVPDRPLKSGRSGVFGDVW